MFKSLFSVLLLVFAFSAQAITFSLLSKPYQAHPHNQYQKYTQEWVEFEASHYQKKNVFSFRSTNQAIVEAYFKTSFGWTEESIQAKPEQFESKIANHIEQNKLRNEALLIVVKEADRYFTPEGQKKMVQQIEQLMAALAYDCAYPKSQKKFLEENAIYSFRRGYSFSKTLSGVVEECQYRAEASENNVLSRWYRGDYTTRQKEIFSWDNHEGEELAVKKYRQASKLTQKIIHQALSDTNIYEYVDETVSLEMLQYIDDISIYPTTFNTDPKRKLFFVTVGVGGGNGYDLFYRLINNKITLEYADFDGDIEFLKNEYNKDLID